MDIEKQQTEQNNQEQQQEDIIEEKKEIHNEIEQLKEIENVKQQQVNKVSELRIHKQQSHPKQQQNNVNNKDKLHGYDFFKKIGSPQYICAPMVDQSELAFRMLCKKYGTTLTYTPMIHSKVLQDQGYSYLNTVFSTAEEERPVIAQFCGNNPDTLLSACRFVENKVDAIDINFGCPQAIAKRGRYGSYLLTEPDLIVSLVKKLHENLSIPVTCKIRMLPNPKQTIELAKRIESAGCSILTVHGRTKEQNKDAVGQCDWDIIKQIKEELSIPVFANGGIYTFEDVQRCLEYTGVDGVMSAEGLLENPALFSGKIYDLDDIASDYLDFTEKYTTPHFFSKGHLFKILHTGLQQHTDLRSKLANVKTLEEQREIVKEMKKRREGVSKEDKFGWYTRYWDKMGVNRDVYNQGCPGSCNNKDNQSSEQQQEQIQEAKQNVEKIENNNVNQNQNNGQDNEEQKINNINNENSTNNNI